MSTRTNWILAFRLFFFITIVVIDIVSDFVVWESIDDLSSKYKANSDLLSMDPSYSPTSQLVANLTNQFGGLTLEEQAATCNIPVLAELVASGDVASQADDFRRLASVSLVFIVLSLIPLVLVMLWGSGVYCCAKNEARHLKSPKLRWTYIVFKVLVQILEDVPQSIIAISFLIFRFRAQDGLHCQQCFVDKALCRKKFTSGDTVFEALDSDSDVSFNLVMAVISMMHSGGSIAVTYLLDPRVKMSSGAVCCRVLLVPFLSLMYAVAMLVPMSGHVYVNLAQDLGLDSDSHREFFLSTFVLGLAVWLAWAFWFVCGYKKREEAARSAQYY